MSNLTGNQANVTAHFVEAGGTIAGTKSYTVPANNLNQINRVVSDILNQASPTGRQGYLILESDQKIAAVVSVIDNVTIDSAVIGSSRGPSGHLLFPTSVSTATFKTTMTLVNDSLAANTIEVRLRPADGGPAITKTVNLAPYGQFHADDAYSFLEAPSTFGPIELTSKNTTPQPFIGVSRVYSTVTVSAPTTGTGQTSSFFSAVPF
jgi:hypothetical protein